MQRSRSGGQGSPRTEISEYQILSRRLSCGIPNNVDLLELFWPFGFRWCCKVLNVDELEWSPTPWDAGLMHGWEIPLAIAAAVFPIALMLGERLWRGRRVQQEHVKMMRDLVSSGLRQADADRAVRKIGLKVRAARRGPRNQVGNVRLESVDARDLRPYVVPLQGGTVVVAGDENHAVPLQIVVAGDAVGGTELIHQVAVQLRLNLHAPNEENAPRMQEGIEAEYAANESPVRDSTDQADTSAVATTRTPTL
jgi:hypothetical protein